MTISPMSTCCEFPLTKAKQFHMNEDLIRDPKQNKQMTKKRANPNNNNNTQTPSQGDVMVRCQHDHMRV